MRVYAKKAKKNPPAGLGEKLIEHMSQGHSFRSFAAKCDYSYETLKRWAEKNKSFREAKSKAESHALNFFETERNAASLGQLRTVSQETIKRSVFYDEKGKPIKGEDGKTKVHEEIIERKYRRTEFKEASWIFIMKSRFNYTDFVPADPMNVDPDKTTESFTMAYPAGPLIPHEIEKTQDVSNEQEKQEAAVVSG